MSDIVIAGHEPDRSAKVFEMRFEISAFLRLAGLREVPGNEHQVNLGRIDLSDGFLEMRMESRVHAIRRAIDVRIGKQSDPRQCFWGGRRRRACTGDNGATEQGSNDSIDTPADFHAAGSYIHDARFHA
jgi:hypothetical protein